MLESLTARLGQTREAKTVAQIGAVIGADFTAGLLIAVSGAEREFIEDSLDKLLERRLLCKHGARYSFSHALLRDAVYDSVLPRERQELHVRVADVLERLAGLQGDLKPELIAHHFALAGNASKAVEFSIRAARLALNHSANDAVIDHAEKGLKFLRRLKSGIERDRLEIELRYAMGIALRDLDGFHAQSTESAFRHTLELCERVHDRQRLSTTLRALHNSWFAMGKHRNCRTLVTQALRLANESGKSDEMANALIMQGVNTLHRAELETAETCFHRVLATSKAAPSNSRTTAISGYRDGCADEPRIGKVASGLS